MTEPESVLDARAAPDARQRAFSALRRRLLTATAGLAGLSSIFGAWTPVHAADSPEREFRPTDRLALLISNGDYPTGKELPPAGKNLADVTALFKSLGFEVTPYLDIGPADMTRAIVEFGEKVRARRVDWKAGQGAVVFYFFGHGIEIDGRNLLLPAGVDPASKEVFKVSKDLMRDIVLALPRGLIGSEDFPGATVALVDACRVGTASATDSGRLTQVTPPKGAILLFGTRAGRPAISPDSATANSYFTAALIETWRESSGNTSIYDLCKATEDRCLQNVMRLYAARGSTLQPQYPETSANIEGAFVLPRTGGTATPIVAGEEEEDWRQIQATILPRQLITVCNAFLGKFPQSEHAVAARARRQGAEAFVRAVTKPPEPMRPLKGFLSDDVIDKTGDARYRDTAAKALRGDKDAAMRIAQAYRAGALGLLRNPDRYERWLALAMSLGNGVAFWERHQYLSKDGRQEMSDEDALALAKQEYGYVPTGRAAFERDSRS